MRKLTLTFAAGLLLMISSCKKPVVVPDVVTENQELVVSTIGGGAASGYADGPAADSRFWRPAGIAVDASGNVFITDLFNNCIRKITPAGIVSTFAGSATSSGVVDGTGTAARFNRPSGMVIDASGNLYVTDNSSYIRKITPAAVVTTLAGDSDGGYADGTGSAAKFRFVVSVYPQGMAIDASGNIYVTDYNNRRIRKITSAGVVTTVMGGGGDDYNGPVADAAVYQPTALAIDKAGNIYFVGTSSDCAIRKISTDGIVSTYAGTMGFQYFGVSSNNSYVSINGSLSTAAFTGIMGLTIDLSGNMYVTTLDHTIRKISTEGIVNTIGVPRIVTPGLAGAVGNPPLKVFGHVDGLAAQAQFYFPRSITTDKDGNIYVCQGDAMNNPSSYSCIRKISKVSVKETEGGSTTVDPGWENWDKPNTWPKQLN